MMPGRRPQATLKEIPGGVVLRIDIPAAGWASLAAHQHNVGEDKKETLVWGCKAIDAYFSKQLLCCLFQPTQRPVARHGV